MIEGYAKNMMMQLLNEEHAERIDALKMVAVVLLDTRDLNRRLAREQLRYERAISAIRSYFLSVEEWEDEEGIDDPHKYHHWRTYIYRMDK